MDLTDPQNQELDRIVRELNLHLEKLHTDYSKFFTGAEKKPPIQLREQVDKLIDRTRVLQRQCQTNSLNFKTQAVLNKYNSYKALWDKKMAAREQATRRT